jgi:uncharacterized coiled-coil protein SlyX
MLQKFKETYNTKISDQDQTIAEQQSTIAEQQETLTMLSDKSRACAFFIFLQS